MKRAKQVLFSISSLLSPLFSPLDPTLGTFISPDTLVPDAGVVFDYNRYMYVRGNPLKYTDPTGHYSDEALYDHFGCTGDNRNWGCVEGHFMDGGTHAGLWGWLEILRSAEDNDYVRVMAYTNGMMEAQGKFATVNGKIVVQQGKLTSDHKSYLSLGDSISEGGFASLAHLGSPDVSSTQAFYMSTRGGAAHNYRAPDCRHTDCTGRTLNAIATGSAGIAVLCASSIVGNAGCTQTALFASSLFGYLGAARTVVRASLGEAHALDAALAVTLLKAGAQASPLTNLGVNLVQWGWDESISPRLPQPY